MRTSDNTTLCGQEGAGMQNQAEMCQVVTPAGIALPRMLSLALIVVLIIGGIALFARAGSQHAVARRSMVYGGVLTPNIPTAAPIRLAPDTAVAMFTPRTGEWSSAQLHDVRPGGEFIYQSHLYRVTDGGAVAMLPGVDVRKLPDADRAFDTTHHRFPDAGDVVMVLDQDMQFTHHAVLGTLPPGSRVCFQGRAYDLCAGRTAGTLDVVAAGIVSARVTKTFQHTGEKAANTLIDVTFRTADGRQSALHATPNHPFYVPDRKEYVELGQLTPGTKLQTADQGEATIVAMNTRKGQFDVYNLEVEGPHNYYVGDQKVLVHNKAAIFKPYSHAWIKRSLFRDLSKNLHPNTMRKFTNALEQVADPQGQAGIKRISIQGYEYELKIMGSGDRLLGNIDSNGVLVFEKYVRGGLH